MIFTTEFQIVAYFVIGVTLGLTFSTFVIYDRAMDDRVIFLGLLTLFWLPALAIILLVGVLWSLVKSGDFAVKIARSILKL